MKNTLWRITLDTNPEECNLQCIMCEENSEYSRFKETLFRKTGIRKRVMPSEWIEPLIREASEAGVREIIPTTMGDPLVSKNFEIIAGCVKKYGLKLNVTHNGSFPRKGVIYWANLICPITSDIKISWNGAKAETAEHVMKGIDFEKAKENLRLFLSERDRIFREQGHYCSVSLQLTFMTLNLHEIPSIIEFAASIGIDRVKGHHLWTHFPEIEAYALTNSPEKIDQWNSMVNTINENLDHLTSRYGKTPKLEGFFIIRNDEQEGVPESYHCPFLGKELWISAEGNYAPCCAPDELRKSLGDFGRFPDKSLHEVLQTNEYQWLLHNYKTLTLCKHCKMRKA